MKRIFFKVPASAVYGMGIIICLCIGIHSPVIAAGSQQSLVGIPEISFGINQVAPARPKPWNSPVAGYYYIDENDEKATDLFNKYGHPNRPRKSMPNELMAGSVVEIHGASMSYEGNIAVSGSQKEPVFIRGLSYEKRVRVTRHWEILGGYCIIENLHFGPVDPSNSSFGINIREGTHHIAVRNCEFSGNDNRAGGVGIGSWGYSGSESTSYIVLNNLLMHNFGKIQKGVDTDAHGVSLNGSVDHFWLINSQIAHCAGDGIQIEAQSGRQDKINHIYIGNNDFHHNKQSGVWIKHATDVIVSQNLIHDSKRIDSYSGGQGAGWQYDNDYIWFINNRIFNCEQGIAVESENNGSGFHHFIIGNVIYNIQSSIQDNPHGYGALKIRSGRGVSIINNTVFDYDVGLSVLYDNIDLTIVNNIWAQRKIASPVMWYVEGTITASEANIDHNLFDILGFQIIWNSIEFNKLSKWQTYAGKCMHCVVSDPQFKNREAYLLMPASSSPAVDKGSANSAFDQFYERYKIRMAIDISGNSRPAGKNWDIGAYENVIQ